MRSHQCKVLRGSQHLSCFISRQFLLKQFKMKVRWSVLGTVVFFLLSVLMTFAFIWQYRMPKLRTGDVTHPHMAQWHELPQGFTWLNALICYCKWLFVELLQDYIVMEIVTAGLAPVKAKTRGAGCSPERHCLLLSASEH